MKRTALLLLTFVYLASCVGVAVNKFYCCGILKSVSLSASATNVSNSAKKYQCCNRTSQTFKVEDQHLASEVVLIHAAPIIAITHSLLSQMKVRVASLPKSSISSNNAPPNVLGKPIYDLYCNYRI